MGPELQAMHPHGTAQAGAIGQQVREIEEVGGGNGTTEPAVEIPHRRPS